MQRSRFTVIKKDWILKFRNENIVWRVKTTYPESKRSKNALFRCDYRCQHAAGNPKRLKSKQRSRNTDCPATLFVTIFGCREEVKAVDCSLHKNWPCIVKLKGDHNHRLTGAEVLRYQPILEKTRLEMIELFERGHSPASAYHTLCAMRMEDYGSIYHTLSADRRIVPLREDFKSLWKKVFKNKYGEKSGDKMIEALQLRLQELSQCGFSGKVSNVDNHYAVSLCTPTMKRAHHVPQAKEMMFVDATGNCDVQNHRVYFFLVHSLAGGIPIGCIITDCGKAEVFEAGVEALRACFPEYAFHGNDGPSIILTDDDMNERRILHKFWPNSKLLLCTFHILKACWRWLLDSNHGINKNERQKFFHMFKDVVYAQTMSEYEEKKVILENQIKGTKFLKYIEKMCIRSTEWALCFRKDLLTRGNDTNNYAEVSFRLFKDIPLERTKAFNLPQLVDFISVCFERYYQQRILDTIHGRLNSNTLQKYICEYETNVKVQKVNNNSFIVQSFTEKDVNYKVDMTVGICECYIGRVGKLCKHQVVIMNRYKIFGSPNFMNIEAKQLLYEVATGEKPKDEWFAGLSNCTNISSITTNQTNTDDSLQLNTVECEDNPDIMSLTADIQINPDDSLLQNSAESQNNSCMTLESLNAEDSSPIVYVTNESIQAVLGHIDELAERMKAELRKDPENFLPIFNKMFKNYHKYASTTTNFMSAISLAFNLSNVGVLARKRQGVPTTRKGNKIPVQPQSIGRRKSQLTGKRKNVSGRKPGQKVWGRNLKEHDYTGLGYLPTKKRKVSHSLSTCVDSNTSLGDSRQQK